MNKEFIRNTKKKFISEYGSKPLLIFSPGRINLIGEHTDYNDGFVFPAAIDKGICLALYKSSASCSSITALDVDDRLEFSLGTIEPIKNGGWKNYVIGVVAEIQKTGKELKNFNIVFGGDVPFGAGLSSSAALENSIVFGLNELFQLGFTKMEMIYISQKAEHNYVGVNCGIMDQYASMFGQKRKALFLDCRTLKSVPVQIDFKDHQILLINSNVKHSLAESTYNDRRASCELIVELLNIKALRDITEQELFEIKSKVSDEDYQKALYVIQENERVVKTFEAFQNNDLETVGKLLYESHKGMQFQYKISCVELDFLIQKAKETPDVLGGRMMGGGFGGCTINIVKKDGLQSFQNKISNAYKERFNTYCSFYMVNLAEGTRLIE
jgi:galactokinase